MWVVFEGLDKTGKGTLEREFLKAVNYEHIIVDRGPVGYMTFDTIFKRDSELRKRHFIYEASEMMNSNDYLVVYCMVDKDVADARIKAHNETCPYDYAEAQKLYRSNVDKYYRSSRVVEVDTTFLTVDECVKIIVGKLKEVQ